MAENEVKRPMVAFIGGGRNAGRTLKAHIDLLEELEAYRAIGTAEECRVAVERMKPKKILKREDGYKCRICNHWVGFRYGYCDGCGQKLDWSE